MAELKTSEAWAEEIKVRVLDPDGWDRRNYDTSWNEEIDFDEFCRRLAPSTAFYTDVSPEDMARINAALGRGRKP